MAKLEFRSPDFKDGGKIPVEFTCDSGNNPETFKKSLQNKSLCTEVSASGVNPKMQWRFCLLDPSDKSSKYKKELAERVKELKTLQSFVIIVDDPDAIPVVGKVFTHFAVINLPCSLRSIKCDQDFCKIENNGVGTNAVKVLLNDAGEVGWFGPCPPPSDGYHHYRFTIYALDRFLHLPTKTKLTVEIFERNFSRFIIDKAQFTGKYKRKSSIKEDTKSHLTKQSKTKHLGESLLVRVKGD